MALSRLSTFEEEYKDMVTCSVCWEEYEPSKRIARALPCQHVFCEPCLGRLHKIRYVPCPKCRVKFSVKDVSLLPLAAHVNKTRALLKQAEAGGHFCQSCFQKNRYVTCVVRCINCSRRLCEECQRTHNEISAFADHKLVSWSGDTQKEYQCQIHHSKYEYYCKPCRTAACTDCLLTGGHNGEDHDPVHIKDVMQEINETLDRWRNDLNGKLFSIKQTMVKYEKDACENILSQREIIQLSCAERTDELNLDHGKKVIQASEILDSVEKKRLQEIALVTSDIETIKYKLDQMKTDKLLLLTGLHTVKQQIRALMKQRLITPVMLPVFIPSRQMTTFGKVQE